MEDSKRLTSTRYIMDDETPCQFCDMAIQNCCPYKGLTDEAKERRCRVYLYFMALKAHEAEKFGKADEAREIRLCECVFDISLVAQHMIEGEQISAEDSRELFSSIHEWAKQFEEVLGAGLIDDYMEVVENFAKDKLLERYKAPEFKRKELLAEPAALAHFMIGDLGNGAEGYDRWSNYFGVAKEAGSERAEKVTVALGEAKHNLPESEWYYTIHVINDVDGTDCGLHHTDHLSEDELVALLTDLMKKMERGEL